MSPQVYFASLTYQRLRSLLVPCTSGLRISVTNSLIKQDLITTAERWLRAASAEPSRKRSVVALQQRDMAKAGVRLRRLMEQAGVAWPAP